MAASSCDFFDLTNCLALETASGDIGSLFQRAFVMNLFDTQLDTFSEEKEKLRDCITEVRASINSVESELRLPRFRLPKDVRSRLSLRAQKISRSLVLIAWALWHREKVANCTRGAHIGKMESTSSETKDFGALAATCALHLNSLGMVYGDNDELYTIQLSLLEDATQ
ncbi:hypothetical protein GQ600_15374 [Phytophthora cactorum]|nr:hypothetical protein GQ600_15374 [Phytophthora cactorum]